LGVVHLVFLQVALGISTLIYLVPTPLAAAHQAGSLALLSGVLVLGSRTWVPRRTLDLVAKRAKAASDVVVAKERMRVLAQGKGIQGRLRDIRAQRAPKNVE
jgi:cytochrome c oxidase assembly protein subunit 15